MPNLNPQPMPNPTPNLSLDVAPHLPLDITLDVELNKAYKGYKAYKSQYNQQGNTLLETLLVISIMSLLMLGAIPSIKKILIQTDQAIALDRIKNAIEFAKNEAFRRNKTITLCPSLNQNSCGYGESWEVGYLLFENPARNTQPAIGSIIRVFSGASYGKIVYNATGNQLNIHADGTTNNIGNFIYCPKDKNIIKPKGLVLNWVARIYPAEENPDKPIGSYCY